MPGPLSPPVSFMPPLISVVVMTWNRPESLRRCLDALDAQTLPRERFEVVVVDVSDSPVTDVIPGLSSRLAVRRVVGANLGVAGNRNRGVAAASGRLIAFLDDDCTAASDWLERITETLSARPTSIVGGPVQHTGPVNAIELAGQVITDLVHEFYNPPGCEPRFFPGLNFAIERDRYLSVGGCDEGFGRLAAEDRDFIDRWRLSGGALVWCPAARVDHEHRRNLAGFVRQYFNYGRGAWHYHQLRRQRDSGVIWEDIRLHLKLPRMLARPLRDLSPVMCAKVIGLIAVWQGANATGFAWQAGKDMLLPRRSPSAGAREW